jgi:glyoxylase-like metal-dependent hydrolase (beta-lactamase superfamily II)
MRRFLPLLLLLGCSTAPEPPPVAVAADLDAHCREIIGEPRIEEPVPGVLVAVGWDLANTILIQTGAGHVVVDAGMSPARASAVREALLERAPGPIAAVVYTHSHIDHVGGASVWVEEGTQIWATDRFVGHFFKQYDRFLRAEATRAARQFGDGIPEESLPCSALGRRVDIDAALTIGARMPTHTFTGAHTLTVGGVSIELVEAHGETDDQLFVWLPASRALLPGDNWYRAFPNLYTIRGSRPRPVDAWIASLDAMRRRQPDVLIPSHRWWGARPSPRSSRRTATPSSGCATPSCGAPTPACPWTAS